MVQEKIDDHTCYRHIDPDWVSPNSDFSVLFKVLLKCPTERKKGKRHNHSSERRVRDEYEEIKRSNPPFSPKGGRSMIIVIYQIRDQEEGGCGKGADHKCSMSFQIVSPDKKMPHRQEECTGGVKRRIYSRKIRYGNQQDSPFEESLTVTADSQSVKRSQFVDNHEEHKRRKV